MSKTFTYTKITQHVYLESTDEYEEFGFEFDYEVDDEDLRHALADIISTEYFDDYNKGYDKVHKFIYDLDLVDTLVESYKDELRDYFEDEAFDSIS